MIFDISLNLLFVKYMENILRWGWLGWGSGGEKMETTVLEQQ